MTDETDDPNKTKPDSESDSIPEAVPGFQFDMSDIAGLSPSSDPEPEPAEPSPAPEAFEAPVLIEKEPTVSIAPDPIETAPPTPAPALDPIQKVKEYAEKVQIEKVQIPAAFPFSLLIEGELAPEEKEKLLDVLSREQMGIREVDLEPQFESHRVLIPRISEYAGILLVQALRGTRARMRLGPSDTIFSTADTEASSDPLQPGTGVHIQASSSESADQETHPAETLSMTTEAELPQLKDFQVIDTIVASSLLESTQVEAEKSAEYQEILESLIRELKFKAFRKGAQGLVKFRIELQQLSLATRYRLLVSAIAIKESAPGSSPSRDEPATFQ